MSAALWILLPVLSPLAVLLVLGLIRWWRRDPADPVFGKDVGR